MDSLIKGTTGSWEVIIGLEVHAQITARSKLFSGAATAFGAPPNSQVSFVDAAMPGVLPVLNEFCVDQAIKSGLGLKAKVNPFSVFDRKNYFYPDLPQGYQISQYHYPIVTGGVVAIEVEGKPKQIRLTRIHLEQDAGKSVHDLDPHKSHIDLNRAGVALMEIVSEPDMNSAAEAMAFVKKLRSVLRYLGTCDGNMEEGSLRADANVSLRRPGEALGTRAEIKNVNSIRFLGQAIEYEISRQLAILENGQSVIQETRLFDPARGVTRTMRTKEDAHDYRYFPEPNLLPLRLTSERVQKILKEMPELPDDKKNRFIESLGLSTYDASILVAEKETAAYYEQALLASANPARAAKLIANWLTVEVFGLLNRQNIALEACPILPAHLAQLVDLILDQTISGKIAKDVFGQMWDNGEAPSVLVDKLGLRQIKDNGAIEKVVDAILSQEAAKVAQYKNGKSQLFGYFVGQVMKSMQGKGSPVLINDILQKRLG